MVLVLVLVKNINVFLNSNTSQHCKFEVLHLNHLAPSIQLQREPFAGRTRTHLVLSMRPDAGVPIVETYQCFTS